MKPKNILVFGASGQIGRNLIRKLTKKKLQSNCSNKKFTSKRICSKNSGKSWLYRYCRSEYI